LSVRSSTDDIDLKQRLNDFKQPFSSHKSKPLNGLELFFGADSDSKDVEASYLNKFNLNGASNEADNDFKALKPLKGILTIQLFFLNSVNNNASDNFRRKS
jgi:hypothetical protein